MKGKLTNYVKSINFVDLPIKTDISNPMKTNLSSQIKLDRIPRRFYTPQSDIEIAALTREEKVYTRIFETADDGSRYLARHVSEVISSSVAARGKCVMAIGAGRATHNVYQHLIGMYDRGRGEF